MGTIADVEAGDVPVEIKRPDHALRAHNRA